ncbi:MAG: hypothetical protein CME07_02135 [Gemmatimonadetes bacterium]|nr:hypothetical protein [Gemmatimonadota bacterium]
MQTPGNTPRERITQAPESRGNHGRHPFLATLSVLALVIALGILGGSSRVTPVAAEANAPSRTLRGDTSILHRQDAVSGGDRYERPACPVPSRVAGSVRVRIP